MSNLSTVNGLPANATLTGTQGPAQRELGSEDFLKLLMAQIANQDPLSPFDSDRMMEQISQMNLVQQAMAQTEKLDALLVGIGALNNENAVNLVGKTVDALGATFARETDGPETLNFSLAGQAEDVHVAIQDQDGRVVGAVNAHHRGAGENTVTWDGRDLNGNPVPPGQYTFAVTATNEAGQRVEATTAISGIVTEIRFDRGYPVLVIEGQDVTLDQILRIRVGESDAANPVDPPSDPMDLAAAVVATQPSQLEAFLNALAQVRG
jgi:flagellar basal-body rod modification protein FlgD